MPALPIYGLTFLVLILAFFCFFLFRRTVLLTAVNSRLRREAGEHLQAEEELRGAQEALWNRARVLDELNKKMIETERQKDGFFAGISHELRTPLTLILGPLESLIAGDYGALRGDQRRSLETMHNNAVRLLQMVTGLLDFSKFEAGKITVEKEPLDIVALAQSVLSDFGPAMRARGIEGAFRCDFAQAYVRMDRYLFERILFNLLSNAVKFTPPGGQVSIALALHGDRLRLSVRDTGAGIPEADLKNLFQKFRQLEGASTRRFEGAGLGLALVKEFSGLLDGNVSVESSEGRGSTFTVDLLAPRCDAPSAAPAPETAHSAVPRFSGPEPAGRGEPAPAEDGLPKILIAEDNVELGRYMQALLREFCSTVLACDGEEAAGLVGRWGPDLVISDVMLPGKDGLTLCREIKSNPDTSMIPVVLVTALTHRDALVKGWEAGADEYLFKPFHPRELVARIKSVLAAVQERKRSEQRLRAFNAALERRVAERTEELRRSNEELEQFAFIASHDLQEPLRKIIVFGDRLKAQSEGRIDERGLDYLDRMQKAAQRMRQLVEDLLQFSRVTRRVQPFQRVELQALVQEVLADLELAVNDSGARIEVGPLPAVQADPVQMHELFQNLIANAIKFRKKDEPCRVWVRGELLEGSAAITVQDNGIGFEEKYVERIFKPFQRLHSRDEYEGSGIGLAICQKIAARHGGQICARSEPGKGAAFTVTLPKAAEQPPAEAQAGTKTEEAQR